MMRCYLVAVMLTLSLPGAVGCRSMVGARPASKPAPAPAPAPAPVPAPAPAPATSTTSTATTTEVAAPSVAAPMVTAAPAKPAAPVTTAQFEKAAMSYAFIDGKTGRSVDTPTAVAQLSAAQLVCLGEEHDELRHHWAQRELLKHLSVGALPGSVALGLEMVQAPFQGVLDDFEAAAIDARTLLVRSGWATRWGFDFGLYQPILATAIASKIKLLALNAPRELTRRVGRVGLEALTAEEKAQLPSITALPAHEAWFWQQMLGTGHAMPVGDGDEKSGVDDGTTQARGRRYYQVQEIWDETMAENAAKWLRLDKSRRIIVLAGNGHCHALGIPARATRRGVKKILTVQPIVDENDDRIADEISARQYDLLMILRKP